MKLMPTYSVALYSAQKCLFFDSAETAELADCVPLNDGPLPDPEQLKLIQQTLSLERMSSASRMIVLVPDSWLCVSQHSIDHLIPFSLLPLAALSYAVETTFSPPEKVMFSYQQAILPGQHTQLTVFACSAEWAEQLCLPFQSCEKSCLLMSQGQWFDRQSRILSWSFCVQRALSLFQPDKAKRKKARRLWGVLLMLSVLIHGVASVYFLSLQQHSAQALIARQKILVAQSDWASAQESNTFSETILRLVQALPRSARLAYFDGGASLVSFKLTLPKLDFDLLLDNWKKQHPDWRWQIERQPYYLSSTMDQGEVVDVSISVFEN